jgi:hypothetical protein
MKPRISRIGTNFFQPNFAGEWVGKLPVTFSIEREKLRVVVP